MQKIKRMLMWMLVLCLTLLDFSGIAGFSGLFVEASGSANAVNILSASLIDGDESGWCQLSFDINMPSSAIDKMGIWLTEVNPVDPNAPKKSDELVLDKGYLTTTEANGVTTVVTALTSLLKENGIGRDFFGDYEVQFYIESGGVKYYSRDFNIDLVGNFDLRGPAFSSVQQFYPLTSKPLVQYGATYSSPNSHIFYELSRLGDGATPPENIMHLNFGFDSQEAFVAKNDAAQLSCVEILEYTAQSHELTIDVLKLYEGIVKRPPLQQGIYQLKMRALEFGEIFVSEYSVYFLVDKNPPYLNVEKVETENLSENTFQVEVNDESSYELVTQELIDNYKIVIPEQLKGLLTFNIRNSENLLVHSFQQEVQIPVLDAVTAMVTMPDDLAPGEYVLEVVAEDSVGNTSAIEGETLSFTVLPKPSGKVSTMTPLTNKSSLVIDYSLDEFSAQTEFRYELDLPKGSKMSKAYAKLDHQQGLGSFTLNIETLEEGEHTLTMQYRNPLPNIVQGGPVRYMDSAQLVCTFTVDRTAPTAKVSYSTLQPTDEPVIAELIEIKDNYSTSENIKISPSIKKLTLTSADQILEFSLEDEAGNKALIKAQAPWILRTATPARIQYNTSEPTKQDVQASLVLDKPQVPSNQPLLPREVKLLGDVPKEHYSLTITAAGLYEYTFKRNGTYLFEYIDQMGRRGYVAANIFNIDRTAPSAVLNYSEAQLTSKSVNAFFTPSENVSYKIVDIHNQVLQEGEATTGNTVRYTFEKNGTATLVLRDLANNVQELPMAVDWIDKTPPVVNIAYSDNYPDSTFLPVTVTVSSEEPIRVLNNLNKYSRTFLDNGDYAFIVEDMAGNRIEKLVSIKNITRIIPKFQITYSEVSLTNQNVTADLSADVNFTVLNNQGETSYVFNSNGIFIFIAKDIYGTTHRIIARTTNIDKVPPTIAFDVQDIVGEIGRPIDLTAGVSVHDDRGVDPLGLSVVGNVNSFMPGTYYADYTYKDLAGNRVVTRRMVIVPDKPIIRIDGVVTSQNLMVLKSPNAIVDVMNTFGTYELQLKKGLLGAGAFKRNKALISEGPLPLLDSGYYTLYFIDQERHAILVKIYVPE